jgi:hypothetical protein
VAASGAAPASRTISPASVSVSSRVPATWAPRSTRQDSTTSRAFPTLAPIGQLMSVIARDAAAPIARVVATSRAASERAESRVFMNAPLPHFTS